MDRRRGREPDPISELIEAVRLQQRSGARLVAFFGCLYFAGLRPEEVVGLVRADLKLPTGTGWGELLIARAEPCTGREWTDSGKNRDRRHLKQRARNEIRPVPCPPELTALLRAPGHVETTADGRLFTDV